MKRPLPRLTSTALLGLALILLASCARQQPVREIDWAKAALARNPAFEILATDELGGVFTVRDNSSGVVRTLRLDDLIAGPLPPKTTAQPAPPTVPAPAAAEAPAEPAEPAAPAPMTDSETVAAARAEGEPLAEGPGYSITRGTPAPPATPPQTLEGPGYSITREEPMVRQSAPRAETVASNVVRRTDPIICQGERAMRIDGETMEFTGDAVIAENGCDLYISNARIRAGGVGIIARQARVHIVNSTIGGSSGSYEASQGAEIYATRSTFSGIGRRFDTAEINDLGGNEFQLHR